MMQQDRTFQFCLSHEADWPVCLRLGRLSGCLHHFRETATDEEGGDVDTWVDLQLAVDGHPIGNKLHSVLSPANREGACWDADERDNQLAFVVKYKHLMASTVLAVSVWAQSETEGPSLVGSSVLPMYSKKGRLKTGLQSLHLWPGAPPHLQWPSNTPSKVPAVDAGELGRLRQAVKRYERGEMAKENWLDVKTFKRIRNLELSDASSKREAPLHMLIEFPTFNQSLLYCQSHTHLTRHMDAPLLDTAPRTRFLEGLQNIFDPEVSRGAEANPCEYKALKLGRAVGKMEIDKEAKPNKDELRVINEVCALPSTRHLSLQQQLLLWKFRFYLATQPRTLIRFLKCVDWADAQEAQLAIANMRDWKSVSVDEGLQMLTADFDNVDVRAFAVGILHSGTKDDDDKVLEILIQLVQCVRYDPPVSQGPSPVADFLVERCHRTTKLTVALHWGLIVDCEDPVLRDRISGMMTSLYDCLKRHNTEGQSVVHDQLRLKGYLKHFSDEMSRQRVGYAQKEEYMRQQLTEYGVFGDLLNLRVPFPLDPDIYLTGIIPGSCKIFKSQRAPVKMSFRTEMRSDAEQRHKISQHAESSQKEPERMHPTSPSLPDGHPAHPGKIHMLYKEGDDLRQDQFVCQLIRLMDKLLKKENVDLRLMPYWVLPTSPTSGIIEFIPSSTLQDLTSKGRGGEGIIKFLVDRNKPNAAGNQVHPEVMENFVRSSAGYAIISYLLDLGDRHLENLLLTDHGNLFHIDFGYVFGMRDPKPWAKVPMSIKPQIVAAMGGQNSSHYRQFLKLAVEAYCILRKHSNLFLTLLTCMAGSSLDCFAGVSNSVTLEFALSQLEERMTVDMTDEEARRHIFALIDQSVSNLAARLGDDAHRIASAMTR